MHDKCPQRLEEGIKFPETGFMDGSEPPHGFWELNPGPLQEQQTLLTTGPSLQPFKHSNTIQSTHILGTYLLRSDGGKILKSFASIITSLHCVSIRAENLIYTIKTL